MGAHRRSRSQPGSILRKMSIREHHEDVRRLFHVVEACAPFRALHDVCQP